VSLRDQQARLGNRRARRAGKKPAATGFFAKTRSAALHNHPVAHVKPVLAIALTDLAAGVGGHAEAES